MQRLEDRLPPALGHRKLWHAIARCLAGDKKAERKAYTTYRELLKRHGCTESEIEESLSKLSQKISKLRSKDKVEWLCFLSSFSSDSLSWWMVIGSPAPDFFSVEELGEYHRYQKLSPFGDSFIFFIYGTGEELLKISVGIHTRFAQTAALSKLPISKKGYYAFVVGKEKVNDQIYELK